MIIKDSMICVMIGVTVLFCGFTSFKLVKKDKKWRIGIGALTICLVALFVFHLLYPWQNGGLFYILFWWKLEYVFMALAAVFAVSLRYPSCKTGSEKTMICFLGSILLLLAVLPFTARPFMHHVWSAKKTYMRDGVVLQQSGYSCGAGSLATVLNSLNFPVTEAEAVIALHVVPVLGTEPDCVPAAVRELTGNQYDAQVRKCTVDELPNVQFPCMATVEHRGLVGHYIAILGCNKDHITIGDPLCGVKKITKSELVEKWKNLVIEIKRQ